AVGAQRGVRHARHLLEQLCELVGVCKLRNPPGRHKARGLKPCDPGPDQRIDQSPLGGGWDLDGFILEAVPWRDLVDRHTIGKLAEERAGHRFAWTQTW